MIDEPVAWIILCIRNRALVDATTAPHVAEFEADPAAWAAKHKAHEPYEEGAIESVVADFAT
jgi:hypothetical protein